MNLPANHQKIIVIVPAYNEKEGIVATLEGLLALQRNLIQSGLTLSVFVIDDGSSDGTGHLAEIAGAGRVIRHKVNQGLGAAVRTGLEAARLAGANIAVKFDADEQHDPQDIPSIIEPIINNEADIVYGDRFEKIEYRMSFTRKTGNFIFTGLMRWLTGWPLKDSQPGILAVRRSYLEVFYLPGDYNYTQQILLDAYHKGMRFAHVPVNFRARTSGTSFVSLKYPFKVITQILLVLVAVKPIRVFVPVGILFLLLGGFIFSYEFIQWLVGETNKPVLHVNAVLGLSFFGLQTFFFGILAELIVRIRQK